MPVAAITLKAARELGGKALRAAAEGRDEDRGGDGGGIEPSVAIEANLPKKFPSAIQQATWIARAGLDPFFAYDANYLIDNKVRIILDAVGTRANRTVEIAITQTMVNQLDS